MLGRSTNNTRGTSHHEGAARQPLLNRSDEDLSARHDDVLFNVDDDSDDPFEETTALDRGDSPPPKSGLSVRFDEDVRIIAPPLRSTTQSREAGK